MARKWGRKKIRQKPDEHLPVESGSKLPGLHIDHAFASTGKVEKKSDWHTLIRDKRAIAGGVALLLVVVVGIYLFFSLRKPEVVVKKGCSTELLNKASPALTPDKVKDLLPIVEEIKKQPAYDQDQNCLVVVLTYYINTSDGKPAKETLDKLKTVYNKEKGYNGAIAWAAQSPDEYNGTVDFLEQQAAKFNQKGISGPKVAE